MAVSDTDYNETYALTDNVGSGQEIAGNGMDQGDVYDLLNDIVTNFNATLAKLDSDGGVTDTDYNSTLALTALSANNIFRNGFNDADLYTVINEIETNFEGVTAKLDADGGVADEDYASTLDWDKETNVRNGAIEQGALVDTLQTIITKFNALLTKLDAD